MHADTAIWLVQCNPSTGDLRAARHGGPTPGWCVKRFLGEIRRGDRVVLWVSGKSAGVYAIGQVAADVVPGTAGDAARMPVELLVDLFDRPVARTSLKADPRWAAESILRQPFGANPHRVSAGAFGAIFDHIGDDGGIVPSGYAEE
jgi:hypothetical protein